MKKILRVLCIGILCIGILGGCTSNNNSSNEIVKLNSEENKELFIRYKKYYDRKAMEELRIRFDKHCVGIRL